MVAVKGIFNGQTIQLLEKVEAKQNTKVLVTFLDENDPEDDTKDLTAQANGLEFWTNSREDIYQDFFTQRGK